MQIHQVTDLLHWSDLESAGKLRPHLLWRYIGGDCENETRPRKQVAVIDLADMNAVATLDQIDANRVLLKDHRQGMPDACKHRPEGRRQIIVIVDGKGSRTPGLRRIAGELAGDREELGVKPLWMQPIQ